MGIDAALALKRALIEKTYTGTCTIVERTNTLDEDTGITYADTEVTVVTDQPCRLSFESNSTVGTSDMSPTQSKSVKLFLAPEVAVTPGSQITVTQNDVTTVFTASGVPSVYTSHQEIMLELDDGWA